MTLEPDLVRVRDEEKRSGSRVEKDKDQSVPSSATTKPALPKQSPTTGTADVTNDKVTNQSKATMDRIYKKKEAWKVMRIKNKSMGSATTTTAALELGDKASVGTGDIEPLSSPLSTEALRILDPPSFYQTGSKANGSSISLGTSSSSQSEFDELLQYFIKTFIFSKKFSC